MVNVIGLGYIGLPTALMMAAHDVDVVGTDCNTTRVEQLNRWEMVFEEKGLSELMSMAKEKGLRFSDKYQRAEMYVVAVPTPYDSNSKKIDPSFVIEAVKQVLRVAPKGAIIVIESTVSPGTIDRFVRPLAKEMGLVDGQDIHFVHAPERIIPGNMIYELLHNSRTIGADSMDIAEKVSAVYKKFCQGTIVTTNVRAAEMTKVVENTFRDINIAYANELAQICRFADMDVYEIIRIANMHPRVNILQPGPGVGGHCISVDPWFLVGDYPELAKIVRTARDINDAMPEYVLKRTSVVLEEEGIRDLSRVGVYGLTYKENVDDTRESPSLQLLDCLKKHLAAPLKCYDPYVKTDMVARQVHDLDSFLGDVDMVIVMVGHDEIRENVKKLSGKIVLDTRNLFTKGDIEKLYKL